MLADHDTWVLATLEVLTFWTSVRPDFVADAPADRNQKSVQQDGDPLGVVKANTEIPMMHERHMMPQIRAEVSNTKTVAWQIRCADIARRS